MGLEGWRQWEYPRQIAAWGQGTAGRRWLTELWDRELLRHRPRGRGSKLVLMTVSSGLFTPFLGPWGRRAESYGRNRQRRRDPGLFFPLQTSSLTGDRGGATLRFAVLHWYKDLLVWWLLLNFISSLGKLHSSCGCY